MEKQSKKIAVIILNWNGKELLERFLPSVLKFSTQAEVIVVDNASVDDSISYLQNNFPDTRIISFEKNLGFAEGYNEALKRVDHEYVVLLNSDVRVTKHWLEAPLEFLEAHTNYAACQPKIKDEKAPNMFEYAGASGGYIDALGYPFCRGRIFDALEEDSGQYNTTKDVFWASGAAFFVKRKAYMEIGGLDASFFAHQEEIDLCWRFLNQGYKIACVPQSTVYHLGAATLDAAHPKKTFLNFRNNLTMMLKNLPTYLLPLIILRMILDGVAGLKYLFDGQFKHFTAILKAHASFYARIPSTLKKRGVTRRMEKSIQYKNWILFDYFIKGNKSFQKLRW
jgi:GT2 family glycosyltransferase